VFCGVWRGSGCVRLRNDWELLNCICGPLLDAIGYLTGRGILVDASALNVTAPIIPNKPHSNITSTPRSMPLLPVVRCICERTLYLDVCILLPLAQTTSMIELDLYNNAPQALYHMPGKSLPAIYNAQCEIRHTYFVRWTTARYTNRRDDRAYVTVHLFSRSIVLSR